MAYNLIEHPSRTMVVGKSGEGKTTLANTLIYTMFNKKKLFSRIILICPSYKTQPNYFWLRHIAHKDKNKEREKRIFFYTVVTDALMASILANQQQYSIPTLLVLDDQTGEQGIQRFGKGAFATLCNNAIWCNLSVMMICHRPKAVDTALRDNLDNIIAFRLLREDQRKCLYQEFFSDMDKKTFMTLYGQVGNHEFIYRHLNGEYLKFLFLGWNKQIRVTQ